ncbi:MAG: thioredoxin fold domain-containing protein [Gammaproteobacteria bacterium]|nr:thioredoxin fold domain-containing protein [Gammaproteobacteria bacterium]
MGRRQGISIVVFLYCMIVGMGQVHAATPAVGGEQLAEGMENPGYAEKPKWFKPSFLDIREDIEEATEARKRVVLYFYQDGCPYCKKLLQDNYGNREIAEFSQLRFDTIAINMWGDREVVNLEGEEVTEKQFAEDLKVMFTPTMLMLNEEGEVVLRINGYYHPAKFLSALKYVARKKELSMSFRDYYGQQPHKKASGTLHVADYFLQPPYDLRAERRASGKPLLVMFEQLQCLSCDELHNDILKREESLKETAKLDIVLLDMWSKARVITPDGRQLMASEWAKELNILNSPSFVFFDDDGQEVFRAEAYLKAFHTQGIMDYVSSGGYKEQPNFQRWLGAKADALEARGIHVDLWE